MRLSEKIKKEFERDEVVEWGLWKVVKDEPDEKRIKTTHGPIDLIYKCNPESLFVRTGIGASRLAIWQEALAPIKRGG